MTRPDIPPLFSKSSGKIIYACLNWGLGHASRSIPVINYLLEKGHEVILASDGEALALLKNEFPSLQSIPCPAYNVKYNSGSLLSIVALNAWKVLLAILKENRLANELVDDIKPDLIISDSRFGFRSSSVKSIIISHQLNLKIWGGLIGRLTHIINQILLNKFDGVWIPDDPNVSLSGKLSFNPAIKNQYFIGALSRLEKRPTQHQYDIAILLSGPENARTLLEARLIKLFTGSSKNIVLVRGTNHAAPLAPESNLTIFDRVNSGKMNEIINASTIIISRSGYSSILDYHKLGKGAYIIPTPGQAEQCYLAEYLNGRDNFIKIDENDLDKLKALA